MADPVAQVDCWCMTCESQVLEARAMNGDLGAWSGRRFIVCPSCGNKRCPRAAHHDQTCTGSNEPGQPGSAYARVRGIQIEAVEPLARPSDDYINALRDLGASQRTIDLALGVRPPSLLERWRRRG